MLEFEKLYSEYLELEKKVRGGEKVKKTAEVVVEIPEEKVVAAEKPNEEITVIQDTTEVIVNEPDQISRDLVIAAEGDLSNLNIPPEHNAAFIQFKAQVDQNGVIEGDLPEFDIVIKEGETVTQQIHTEKGRGFASFTLPPSGGGSLGHGTDEEKRPYQFYTNKEGKEVRIYFSELNVDRSKPYYTANSFMVRRGDAWEKQTGGSSYTHEMKTLMLQQGLMIEEKPEDPAVTQKTKEIEKIIDQSNESKIPRVEKLNQTQLEKEINENIRQLLDREKDKEPKIKKFKFSATRNGFLIKSTISIIGGEPGDKIRFRKDVDIELPLENRNGQLSLGEEKIESWPITKIVRKKFEPLLPQIIPGIKSYFENKYKRDIKSMKIENGELVIEFE